MNILTYTKIKFQEYLIWLKRQWKGDVRPTAVRETKPKKRTTTRKKTK